MAIFDEQSFQSWYKRQAAKTGINPDPDDPAHFYDYRGAYKAGVRGPNEEGHWPSQFKREGNPRLYLNDIDTRTGKPRGGMKMPDYRPIPGQTDRGPSSMNLPMDDLSRMASERASSLLTPYGDQFGQNRPIVPSPGASPSPAPPVTSPSMEDKLYQSIHPDTFAKVLETIMQFVTGKPIPRQFGGSAEPGKEYIVGEEGPEKFKPAVPGQIIPYGKEPSALGSVPGRLTYAGEEGLGPAIYHGLRNLPRVTPYESPYEPGLPSFQLPTGEGAGRVLPPQRGPSGVSWTPEGGYIPPKYTGPRPWKNVINLRKDETGAYAVPDRSIERVGAGMYGGFPSAAGYRGPSPEELELRARERWAAPGYAEAHPYAIPGYQRGYYEAHPEERAAQEFYDMARGPAPSSYEAGVERMKEMNLMDIVKNPNTTKEARAVASEQLAGLQKRAEREIYAGRGAADIYGRALEHGIGTPGAQEKLAHAQYLREMPAAHLAGINEQSRSHLEGITKTVAGHLEGAKITAGTKDQVIKGLESILAQGFKNAELYGPQAFDPDRVTKDFLRINKALGYISEEQWNKLPQQYKEKQWTEQSLRADLKASGMKDNDIETYIKRAKAVGKV